MHTLAVRLVEAELASAPLAEVIDLADRMQREMAYFVAVAVHDARSAGASWRDIAKATRTAVEVARTRWSAGRVKRLLKRRALEQAMHAPLPSHVVMPRAAGEAELNPPGRKLAAALSYLQRKSPVSIAEAARQADLSPSYISRILAGERLPAWSVVHMMATIFGGTAMDVRLLWEQAQGLPATSRLSVEAAADRLRSALRGLHLAASCPDPAELCAGSHVVPAVVTAALAGDLVPDWPTTALLVTRLQAAPADVRPLWEDVHYAFVADEGLFPADGLLVRRDGAAST
ncbi:helix-turn-helix domain-containing protein [Streptomyces sp. NPDC012637]|uniref:helix-turn-helix domain-containing protein n=1 Tax=Streptomyces sp. NPDC012637 TaxID=3364842 RepID=UPI0036E3FE0A